MFDTDEVRVNDANLTQRYSTSVDANMCHEGEAASWCPVCDAKLLNRRCKMVCKRCGYFASCADFY